MAAQTASVLDGQLAQLCCLTEIELFGHQPAQPAGYQGLRVTQLLHCERPRPQPEKHLGSGCLDPPVTFSTILSQRLDPPLPSLHSRLLHRARYSPHEPPFNSRQ